MTRPLPSNRLSKISSLTSSHILSSTLEMLRATRPINALRSGLIASTRSYAQPAVASAAANSSGGLSPLAQAAAEEVTSKWKGTSAVGGKTKNYIGGEFVESKAEKWLEVRDPVGYRIENTSCAERISGLSADTP